MAKYDALGNYLARRFSREPAGKMSLTFRGVEEVLGFALPHSAHSQRAWWSNSPSHTQAHSWLDIGWRVSKVDFEKETVSFQHNAHLLIGEAANEQGEHLALRVAVDEKGFILVVAGPKACGSSFHTWRQIVQLLIDANPHMFGLLTRQPMHHIFPEMLADIGYSVVNWETGERWG